MAKHQKPKFRVGDLVTKLLADFGSTLVIVVYSNCCFYSVFLNEVATKSIIMFRSIEIRLPSSPMLTIELLNQNMCSTIQQPVCVLDQML